MKIIFWLISVLFFFFFSSRRRHTRFDCDWSSDVCSSDMRVVDVPQEDVPEPIPTHGARRPSGGTAGSRSAAEPPATLTAPAATAEPLAHFDLLEEGPTPRGSGPHGATAGKVLPRADAAH